MSNENSKYFVSNRYTTFRYFVGLEYTNIDYIM